MAESFDVARRPAPICPVCGRTSKPATHPFCSKRCADVDLHRWLSGGYVLPGEPVAIGDEGEDQPPTNEKP